MAAAYLQGDDVPGPEVEVDGVQWRRQRHPLPLAVDGRHDGGRRRETAEGLRWPLEGGVTSPAVRVVPKPLCCPWRPRGPSADKTVGQRPGPRSTTLGGLESQELSTWASVSSSGKWVTARTGWEDARGAPGKGHRHAPRSTWPRPRGRRGSRCEGPRTHRLQAVPRASGEVAGHLDLPSLEHRGDE